MKKLFAVFISSFFVVCSVNGQDEYRIIPSNVLSIHVYEEEDLSLTVKVNTDGTITYPLLGQVKLVGLTIQETEKKITDLLQEKYLVNPQVTIEVIEYGQVYVLGQVAKPGAYPIKLSLTTIEAISLAGGTTKIAAPNKTRVIRVVDGEQKVFRVPVSKILSKGDKKKQNLLLKSDDIVLVPESMF